MIIPAATVLLGGSPAYAGGCRTYVVVTFCGVLNNDSLVPVTAIDSWCASFPGAGVPYFREDLTSDARNCVESGSALNVYYVPPDGTTAGNQIDVDAMRMDANCRTVSNLVPQGNYSQDRVGKGSYWVKFSNWNTIGVTDKTCYAPTGLTVAQQYSWSLVLSWNALAWDSGGYDGDVVWRIRRDGAVVYTGKAAFGSTPGRMTWTDTGLANGSTHSYTVSIYYKTQYGTTAQGSGYEGPKTAPKTGTTIYVPTFQSPAFVPVYSGARYSATMFANAPAFSPSTGQQIGGIYAGYNYVYCAWWGNVYTGTYGHNHFWLWTDLDHWSSGNGKGWVPAYYLANWGNDEAYTDSGGNIESCVYTAQ